MTLLNEYFDIMVEAINEQGGMVDKFIGDAMPASVSHFLTRMTRTAALAGST